ncbi:MAG: hypothetical protein K6U14_11210 [Firmicutes bacterium]|nr:hypothetical protein [Alicyclobacillaceae bacterium]MCL6498181.1 hypothetical protein [Bacillota bacterium]
MAQDPGQAQDHLPSEWVAAILAAVAAWEAEHGHPASTVAVQGVRLVWPRPSPWRWRPR